MCDKVGFQITPPPAPVKLSARMCAYSNVRGDSSPDLLLFLKDHKPVPIKEFTIHEGSLFQMNILGPEPTVYWKTASEIGFILCFADTHGAHCLLSTLPILTCLTLATHLCCRCPLLSPFYRWGTERLSPLPEVTQLTCGEAGFTPRLSSAFLFLCTWFSGFNFNFTNVFLHVRA